MTNRKSNTLLPRTIIFVETKLGMEAIAKDYAPQRWVKSISRTGALSFTTDPRMARRFRTEDEAVKVCERYANALIITLHVDTLRWTDPSDDVGYTYMGYYDGRTGRNQDLFTGGWL
jgi:hypothetical protein